MSSGNNKVSFDLPEDYVEDEAESQLPMASMREEMLLLKKRQQLQSVSNSLSFPTPVRRFVFWTPPKQRQRWGDEDILPHINWGDLFFDLFYVAAAYNLSYVLYYSPSAEGFLYFVGLFGPILLEWFQRTLFDSRFVWGDDPWHKFFEVVYLCVLSLSVVHIRPVHTMRNPAEPDMFDYSIGVTVLAILNIYRSLEVIVAVDGEEAAKRGERNWLVGFLIQLAFYMAAAVRAGISYRTSRSADNYDYGSRSLESVTNACARVLNLASERDLADEVTSGVEDHIPIILCLCGWASSIIILLIRAYFIEKKNGDHMKYNVPMNVEYIIHRFGELVMLLLGESILSILIVKTTDSVHYHVTLYAGIISIVLIQYCHYKYQPHSPNRHAFRRSVKGGATYHAIMIVYAHALVALGTAYKMFLSQYAYEETSKDKKLRYLVTSLMPRHLAGTDYETSFGTLEHKKANANMFCISMALVWVCLEAMWVAHNGKKAYWFYLKTKFGFACSTLRLVLIILMGTISLYAIEPEYVALIGLLFICAEIATAVISDYFWSKLFDIHDDGGHWPNVTEPASTPAPKESIDETMITDDS